MANKQRAIVIEVGLTFTDKGTEHLFRVVQVNDSTDYMPMQELTKAQVNALCESAFWKVTLRPVK